MNITPRFPIYIPSKSRPHGLTAHALTALHLPWTMVVEAEQLDDYRQHFDDDRLLVLDPAYQRDYETCDDLGDTKSKGPGPARNFIWDHAVAQGHEWHWVMDDNIKLFLRLHRNKKIPVGDSAIFRIMEDFALRYSNVGMVGPNYVYFAKARQHIPPFILNTRIYSCNLIRNDLPFRWRGRYNEDTILSLDMLKAGWVTVQFNAFLQDKAGTQTVRGGNTDEFYIHEGTLPKSQMVADVHPDVAKVVWKFGRWHHRVDYRGFRTLGLLRRPDYEPTQSDYAFEIIGRSR